MPRYDSVTKTDRNQAIRDMAKNRPDLTLREIGQIFRKDDGKPLSAVGVWVIVNKGG